VAFGAGRYLVAWEDWRQNRYEIFGARLDPGGSRLGTDIRIGRVIAQSPRARAVRRRGFPVNLVVGRH